MGKLRWGLLGTARIHEAIIPAIRASPRGELAAVGSRTAEGAESFGQKWNIPRRHGSYESLLADPEVDAVYNALPNHLHAEWSIKALQAGKHVLCEKPFALSVDDADAMFKAAETSKRILADGFMYRHHPLIHRARALIADGAIGFPLFFRAMYTLTFDRPRNPRWEKRMGGGALWDVGCYPVNLAIYLFHRAPNSFSGRRRLHPSGVDESFSGGMLFPDGQMAQFVCSFVSQYRTETEVIGTDGSFTLNWPFRPDEPGSHILLRRGFQEETIRVEGAPGRFVCEVEEFHAQVLDGKMPEIGRSETRDTIETCVRLHKDADKPVNR